MDLQTICEYLSRRAPIESVPLQWDATVYTSDELNRHVVEPGFTGWPGEGSTEEEARVIARLLGVHEGSCVLDVACGYGRHAQALSKEYGATVAGIDISPGLIAKAQQLAGEAHVHVDYQAMDARDLSFESAFDGVFIAFNSFSLFSSADAPGVLANIHRALRPAGRLFMDLDNKPVCCRYGVHDSSWETVPAGLKLQELCFHADASVEVCRDICFRAESSPTEGIMLKRLYCRDDICDLLSQCGFHVGELYGDWDLSPLDQDSPKIVLQAAKQ